MCNYKKVFTFSLNYINYTYLHTDERIPDESTFNPYDYKYTKHYRAECHWTGSTNCVDDGPGFVTMIDGNYYWDGPSMSGTITKRHALFIIDNGPRIYTSQATYNKYIYFKNSLSIQLGEYPFTGEFTVTNNSHKVDEVFDNKRYEIGMKFLIYQL